MRLTYRLLAGLVAGCVLTGGALAAAVPPAVEAVHADISQQTIQVEDIRVSFFNEQGVQCDPLNYQGSLYLPVRTAGEWLGAEVGWDQATMTVTLTTGGEPYFRDMYAPDGQTPVEDLEEYAQLLKNGVTARLSPDISVVLDGVEQSFANVNGTPIYPISYQGSVYLPLRSIGQLCGKQVLWLPYPDRSKPILDQAYLYDALTEEQLAAGQAYLTECDRLLAQLEAQKEEIKAAQTWSEELYQSKAAEMTVTAEELARLTWPDITILQTGCKGTKGLAENLVEQYITPQLDPDYYLFPDAAASPWQERRDVFVRLLEESALRDLQNRIEANHRLMDAVAANQS